MEEVSDKKGIANLSRDFEKVFIEVAEKILPSIVKVTTLRLTLNTKGNMSSESGSASGVILTDDGYIITSQHVVNDKSVVQITLNDGTSLNGKVIGVSKIKDLALVKVDCNGLIPIEIAPYDNPKVGQFVMVAGNPIGIGTSMAFGMVSAVDRVLEFGGQYLDSLIQTTAPLNIGNSGGALVDSYGRLVGIATATINMIQGINFAVSALDVKKLLSDYQTYGYIGTPWLGIGVITNDDFVSRRYGLPKGGAVVLVSKGPAMKAGIRAGDVIISASTTDIKDAIELRKIINEYRVGDEIPIVFYRNGSYETSIVELDTMES